MEEINFVYDKCCIYNHEIEFKKIKKISFFKLLYAVFINRFILGYVFVVIFFFCLKLILISTKDVPIECFFIIIFINQISFYRKSHKNVVIPIKKIQYSYIRKNILEIHFDRGIKCIYLGNDKDLIQKVCDLKILKIKDTDCFYKNLDPKMLKLNFILGLIGMFICVLACMCIDIKGNVFYLLNKIAFVFCFIISGVSFFLIKRKKK